VAVALSNLPALLLADEPTAELDSESAERVLSAFRDVNREFHVTVMMVTHDLLAAARADRAVRLRDGRLAAEGHVAGPLDEEGQLTLPTPAVDALYGADLEVEVQDSEVRIRKRAERGSGRPGPSADRTGEPASGQAETTPREPLDPHSPWRPPGG
jgi:ABC-type multidrug transport system ATPase subunit